MNKIFYLRAILITLITSICCSYFGQMLLFLINSSKNYYVYLIYIAPLILILTKYSNKYFKTLDLGMKYFITAANNGKEKVSWYFPILLITNTFFAHITGVSVGREGVAVQFGGAVGLNLSKSNFTESEKKF